MDAGTDALAAREWLLVAGKKAGGNFREAATMNGRYCGHNIPEKACQRSMSVDMAYQELKTSTQFKIFFSQEKKQKILLKTFFHKYPCEKRNTVAKLVKIVYVGASRS